MIWSLIGLAVLFVVAVVLAIAFCGAGFSSDDATRIGPLPDRTAGMCEYGPCRDKATVQLDLGPRGVSFVCDHHVGLIVRENIEPEFEAMGVVA